MRKLILLSLLMTMLPGRAEAARKYRVYIKSNPPGASVYVGSKESGVRGTTRARLYLPRGAHTIIMELAGYQTTAKVIQVLRSSTFTFTLEKEPPKASLGLTLASGDTAGTSVNINGQPGGSLPSSNVLTPGRYLVEVGKEGHETWRQWVELAAGDKRQIMVSLKRTVAKVGALLISASEPDASITVDGKSAGASPALVEDLPVGTHQIIVSAPDHKDATQVALVEQGKTTRITVTLTSLKPASSGGSLQVLADPAGATILLDGKEMGQPPVVAKNLTQGTHIVEAKLAGHETASREVTISDGKLATIKLTLAPIKVAAPEPAAPTQGIVMVTGVPAGSQVAVDDQAAQTISTAGITLTEGEHTLKVTAQGYEPLTRKVSVSAGMTLQLDVTMTAVEQEVVKTKDPATVAKEAETKPDDSPSEIEMVDVKGLSSFGARLVPPKYFTADISAGFPYFLEARMSTGVLDWGHLGLDAGIELKSMFALTEIGLITKLRFLRFDPFTAAAFVGIGGGGGPGSRDTFYFDGGLLLSLSFKDIITFTGRFYANITTDRLCPSSPEDGELDVCSAIPGTTSLEQDPRDRFVTARFYLSAILEVPITDMIGVFGLVEGTPGQAQRPIFTDAFYSLMPTSDPLLYGRAGVSLKF